MPIAGTPPEVSGPRLVNRDQRPVNPAGLGPLLVSYRIISFSHPTCIFDLYVIYILTVERIQASPRLRSPSHPPSLMASISSVLSTLPSTTLATSVVPSSTLPVATSTSPAVAAAPHLDLLRSQEPTAPRIPVSSSTSTAQLHPSTSSPAQRCGLDRWFLSGEGYRMETSGMAARIILNRSAEHDFRDGKCIRQTCLC